MPLFMSLYISSQSFGESMQRKGQAARQVYLVEAKDLQKGDRILTPRMTVAEISTVEVTNTWGEHKAVHITTENALQSCLCFREDELVLIIKP